MLLNSEIKTVPSDCICGKIAKKTRPPEKEKNIAVMPAEFIGKACCGGDKKWGDGRGAGCPKHPHYNCHACGKLLPKMPIDDDFDHNGELDHLFESLGYA